MTAGSGSARDTTPRDVKDDTPLLEAMLRDLKVQDELYGPGPFWQDAATRTAKRVKRYGLSTFRAGAKTTPGSTMSDAPQLSIYDHIYEFPPTLKGTLRRWMFDSYLIRKLLLNHLDEKLRGSAQDGSFRLYRAFRDAWVNEVCDGWFSEVLRTYQIPETTGAGCVDNVQICGRSVGAAYFGSIARLCNFADCVAFDEIETAVIIGGGFGYEVHLLTTLFPNIKKCVTVDIPPYLYIQTQYLKSIFGDQVRDYRDLAGAWRIGFSASEGREILAIAPWQFERVDTSVDLLWNSCSFVEMTVPQVRNYASVSERLLATSSKPRVCLVMYETEQQTKQADVFGAFGRFRFEKIESRRRFYPDSFYREHQYVGSMR